MRTFLHRLLLVFGLASTVMAHAQLQLPSQGNTAGNNSVLTDPTYRDSIQPLLDADKKFAAEVLRGGGSVFASWFADDAVTLNNKKPTVQGKSAITSQTTWKPEDYQLTWAPDGARIAPHGDMGITWGHYEGKSHDNQGNLLVTSGRYITAWEKDKSGQWKVLLDASNDAPAEADSCCSIH